MDTQTIEGLPSLKIQFETIFIPSIERMIEKEKEHLDNLMKKQKKHPKIKDIKYFIGLSGEMLYHYKIRLIEYKNFVKTLDN